MKIIYANIPRVLGLNLIIISSVGCKIYQYFNYGLDALSPFCLVYISVEKFISIAYPNKRLILKKKNIQIYYFVSLCVFNIFYHLNVPISYDTVTISNTTTICFFNNDENQLTVTLMDLIDFILIPFILMIIFSTLLIITIFKSRSKVNNSLKENKRLKKDIKFSISLLSMNLLFILLNLPDEIDLFLPFNNEIYSPLAQLCNLSFAINFYLILFTNSLFRKEFISLFFKKKDENQQRIREMEMKNHSIRHNTETIRQHLETTL